MRTVLGACAALGGGSTIVEVILMTALITVAATAVGAAKLGPDVLRDAAAALFPVIYIGLPLGALAAVRSTAGREAVLLIMAVIVISDSAQYYTGRAFGRSPLAPTISPNKTLEGALGGLVAGLAVALAFGSFAGAGLAQLPALALVAAATVLASILGDLIESLLKRQAGVKDSGDLIPGHGGVLDRIDGVLAALPVFAIGKDIFGF